MNSLLARAPFLRKEDQTAPSHTNGGGGDRVKKAATHKYDWVPLEVRNERTEGMVAYILVGLCAVTLPIVLLIVVLH